MRTSPRGRSSAPMQHRVTPSSWRPTSAAGSRCAPSPRETDWSSGRAVACWSRVPTLWSCVSVRVAPMRWSSCRTSSAVISNASASATNWSSSGSDRLEHVTIDEIIECVDAMGGVLILRPGPGDGSPEISWGDVFFYYAPDGVVPRTQPFATIVTKDYPGDDRSRLDRPDAFRVTVFAGTEAFTRG